MKRILFLIVPLGLAIGCTGNNSSPGFHKTKERPSAAIEPTEKGNGTPPGDSSKKKDAPTKKAESEKAAPK